jgi:asparagine N-glycosylation enzyme membrane subunit Stt3
MTEEEHNVSEHSDKKKSNVNLWKITKSFFLTYGVIFLLIIPIILSVFLRMTPAYLPITDEWAKMTIDNSVKNSLASEINSQFPNMGATERQNLINQQFNELVASDQETYNSQINSISSQFKSELQMDDGQTYLLAIDPYYWLYYARNILDHGNPSDYIKDGKYWSNNSLAPVGRNVVPEFHMYFDAYFYKFMTFFNKDLNLWNTTFIVPVILATLGVIPAFFLARKKGGNIAGLIAGTFVAIHSSFLSRTSAGFADTDPYNVVLPLYVMWFMIEAFESKSWKKSILWTILGTFTLGLFSFAWSGWWYTFDFILISIIVYVIYKLIIGYLQRKTGSENESIKSKKMNLIRSFKIKNFKKIVSEDKKLLNSFFVFGLFIIFSLLFVSIWHVNGINAFRSAFNMPMNIVQLKDVATTQIWPNVLTTVAELNPSSIPQTIETIGGKGLFFCSLLGILLTLCTFNMDGINKKQRTYEWIFFGLSTLFYLLLSYKSSEISSKVGVLFYLILLMIPIITKFILGLFYKFKKVDYLYAIILIIWFVGTIYGSTKGVRFVMLIVPAFSVAIGVFAGILFSVLIKKAKSLLGMNEFLAGSIIALILIVSLISGTWQNSLAVAKSEIPSMNDVWWDGLKEIETNSSGEYAIITSWWDFGHWFRAVPNKAVTFDGASQSTPPAHWVGKALLTSDEKEAFGILRMLDCGWNSAYSILNRDANLTEVQAVDMVYDIIVLNRTEAKKYLLENNISEEISNLVLENSHCENPPKGYFITSEDMVSKSGVWAHFGAWDFHKAELYQKVSKMKQVQGTEYIKEKLNISDSDAYSIYYEIKNSDANDWIADWPSYNSGSFSCSEKMPNLHVCPVSISQTNFVLAMNETSGDVQLIAQNNALALPDSISYVDDDGNFRITDYSSKGLQTAGLSATFVRNGNSYNAILMDSRLVGSMFTRLFYHNGAGLKSFDKIYDKSSMISGRVMIWNINWESEIENN